MLKDYEIAHQKQMVDIRKVASKIDLEEKDLILYGKYKAKLSSVVQKEEGKIILVTSINPTPFGEGKTTVAIGLHDAFWQLGVKSLLTLREPSMGPVFGVKGGATGGGYAQVLPMEDINLHFNGDFHAITSANNLICAMIDNHLKHGNTLNFDVSQIYFHRTMDMNDRALREVQVGLGNGNGISRNEQFTITAASEMMAILCLSEDLKDLRRRVDQIILGKDINGNYILGKDLQVTGSVLALLKDAMKPNLVQTLEENPVLIHGGPFANIAPGVSSIRSLKMALQLSPIVITEAGFGADLGGYKFMDILARKYDVRPSKVLLVVTMKALKYHGGVSVSEITDENMEALEKGLANLGLHMDNLQMLGVDFLVTLNHYDTDIQKEIDFVQKYVESRNCRFVVNYAHRDGGKGTIALASELMNLTESSLNYLYDDQDFISDKIIKVCKKLFHANEVTFSDVAKAKIDEYQKQFGSYPLCISKTQYSISDQKKLLGYPKNFSIYVRDIQVLNGAEFLIIYLGDIVAMPGLPKNPIACDINLDQEENILNIF